MAKIKELIQRAENLSNSGINEPEFKSWKDDVIKFLKKLYGDNSNEAVTFENIDFYNYYLTYDVFNGGWRENILKEKDTFKKGLKTALFYLRNYQEDGYTANYDDKEQKTKNKAFGAGGAADKPAKKAAGGNKIFLVHGRNDGVKTQVSDFLTNAGIKPVTLNKKNVKGSTIMEKIEKNPNVTASIILFSGEEEQNIIFEAGYFLGRLGREYTVILLEEGLAVPDDLEGCKYLEIDKYGKWQSGLASELKNMNFEI